MSIIYHEKYGEGEAIVFLGGIGMTCEGWTLQKNFFSRHFNVILVDNRGSGRSVFSDSFTVSDMVNDTIELIDFLNIKKAHFVCVSMGGFIGIELAARFPERVLSLVLSNTSAKLDSKSVFRLNFWDELKISSAELYLIKDQVLWIFPELTFQNPILIENVIRNMINFQFKQSINGFSTQIAACISFDGAQYLSKIDSPALVMASEDDAIIPALYSKELAAKIKGAQIKIMENTGHVPHLLQSEIFNENIFKFINSVKSDFF